MKKKGQAAIFFVVILAFIILAGLVFTGISLMNNSDWGGDMEEDTEIELFLKGNVDGNYIIFEVENNITSIVRQGQMNSDSYTPIELPKEEGYKVFCWSENYYSDEQDLVFTPSEKLLNKSKKDCEMKEIGEIELMHEGNLKEKENQIKLNISEFGTGEFRRLAVCFSWSAGIIDVEVTNGYAICENADWQNYTQTEYKCGERIESCSSVEKNGCLLSKYKSPQRLASKVDKCYYTGNTLDEESYRLRLDVKTLDFKNSLDFLDIYVFDNDKRFNSQISNFTWMSELEKDLGAEDIKYRISYN